jgi:hypothetical protein
LDLRELMMEHEAASVLVAWHHVIIPMYIHNTAHIQSAALGGSKLWSRSQLFMMCMVDSESRMKTF